MIEEISGKLNSGSAALSCIIQDYNKKISKEEYRELMLAPRLVLKERLRRGQIKRDAQDKTPPS